MSTEKTPVVPDLLPFVEKYMEMKMPMNWHHRLYYDILENRVIQNKEGILELNIHRDGNYHNRHTGATFKETYLSDKVNQNIMLLSPRFHAKSQCFTINYPIWEIYKNPNVRIMIVSANEDIAVSFNRAIMNQLEYNQKLVDELGYMRPKFPQKWGEKTIIVKRDTKEKDPTIAAIGAGGKLISRRADIIIVDDLLDIENARTKTARNKTLEWFENVLLPILEDNGRLILVGTAWYRDDLYDTLWKDSKFDIKLKLKALMYMGSYFEEKRNDQNTSESEVRHIPYDLHEFPLALDAQKLFAEPVQRRYQLYKNLKGGVLWEEKWSFEKLMKKKENMNNSSFMRQYLNEPVIEEEKVFKEIYIKKALDLGSSKSLVPEWDNFDTPPGFSSYGTLITAVGIDLAISKKDTAANSAIAVWGLGKGRVRHPLWLDYGRWSTDETKQRIIEVYHNFHPVKVRVENIAYQEMFRQELAEEIPVEGFQTSAGKKFNPETGLAHISGLMEQGKLSMPADKTNKDYYMKIKQLLFEMQVYTYDTHAGDLLMASWFAIDALRLFDSRIGDDRGFFSTRAIVEMVKQQRASHKIILLGYNPPVYKMAYTSFLSVFLPLQSNFGEFFERTDKFFIFATRSGKSVAYIFNKITSEIVGKIDGDMTALMYATLLEKTARFFNNAQLVIERTNEGDAIYLELLKRNYPKLLCMQPDEDGRPTYKEGFRITPSNFPIIVDNFKQIVDGLQIVMPDDALLTEMRNLIKVEGDNPIMSFGSGQRIKAVSTGLWLLDNYENVDKKLYNGEIKHVSKKKTLNVPYLSFR